MKLITKKEIIPGLILVAVILASFIFYSRLPSKIPSHWNLNGEIDGYMSKNFSVIFFPLLIAGIYLFMTVLPFIDPLRKNIEASAEAYFWLKTILISFFSLLYFYSIYAGINAQGIFSINLFIMPTLGLMIIAIGFLLPKFKKNYFVGIRTPWTLESEEVWIKTHKRAKKWFILAGLLLILGGFMPSIGKWLLIVMILMVLWPVVDSYLLYKK